MNESPAMLACLAVLLQFVSAAAAAQEIDHIIPPGYQPQEARDEQGLWMEIEKYELDLNQSALLVKDPDLNNYVQQVVCRVAGDYCNDFRVYLVRNPGFNASMTATGMMQIWTGLLVRSTATSELAAVIGHEIAHYTRMHTLQRFRNLKKSAAAGSLFDVGIEILTGVSTPVGQTVSTLGVLSFSREQESEADILGARLIAEAAYDPHAAYRVWQRLLAEEEAAAVKRREPGMFSKTHPDAEDRAAELQQYVNSRYPAPDREIVADEQFLEVITDHYLFLMEDQIDTNRFGRTRQLLERHSEMGVEPSLVRYFYGEMFRQRGDDGDRELAMSAYRHSIEGGAAPPQAYKNLGYLHLKEKDLASAQENFRKYLELDPAASDKAMIEFYLAQDPS